MMDTIAYVGSRTSRRLFGRKWPASAVLTHSRHTRMGCSPPTWCLWIATGTLFRPRLPARQIVEIEFERCRDRSQCLYRPGLLASFDLRQIADAQIRLG